MPADRGLSHFRLLIAFGLAFGPFFFLPLLLPTLRLTYFAPYIIIACYKLSLNRALWQALLCGLMIDLFSSSAVFGYHALSYCLATAALHSQTRNFFEDKSSTLPLMTFFFGILSSIFSMLTLKLSGIPLKLSWYWAFTDLALMPMLDAAYAFLWFSLPFQFYAGVSRLIKYVIIWKRRS